MRNKQHNKETKMTKTQEQLRQEGLRAARNMVRKFKAREKIRKGQDMTHDETRDNTTDIEATIIEADEREGWFRNQTTEYYEHPTDYDCP